MLDGWPAVSPLSPDTRLSVAAQAVRSLHDCGLPRRPDAQAITVLVGVASWFKSLVADSRFVSRHRAAAERVGLRPGCRHLPARTRHRSWRNRVGCQTAGCTAFL